MMIQKFIEIPNTIIREPVVNDFGYDLLYDMAQQYGHAQLVWYALNGKELLRENIQIKINLSVAPKL